MQRRDALISTSAVSESRTRPRFEIDDSPSLANPYLAELPKDGIKHRIRAQAQGFAEKVETVAFDGDVSMHIVLSKTADKDR